MDNLIKKIYLSAFLGVALLVVLYNIQIRVDESVADINLIYRRIETPAKLLLNGYLGHFFNFKYLGNLNWLIIPFGLYAVFKLHFFDAPWKKAIALSYLLALLLISVKGYFNSRYQITLMPLTLPIALLFLWLYIQENNLVKFKFRIFLTLVAMVMVNNFVGVIFMQQKTGNRVTEGKAGLLYNLTHLVETLSKIEHKSKTTAYPVIDFIRALPKEDKILVNNLPMLYYYTNKIGTYYWCGDDTYYSDKGRSLLMENRNIDQMRQFINDTLGCKYLLSTDYYNQHSEKFNEFVHSYCKPVFMDNGEFVMYEITAVKGNYTLDKFIKALKKKQNEGVTRISIRSADVE
jgi:hypothetical protein